MKKIIALLALALFSAHAAFAQTPPPQYGYLTPSIYGLLASGGGVSLTGAGTQLSPYSFALGAITPTSETITGNGAASFSPELYSGSWFTGGTGTTTYPYVYLDANGATNPTSWSTAGTAIGINAPSGYTGNFIDFRINGGTSFFNVSNTGTVTGSGFIPYGSLAAGSRMYLPAANTIGFSCNSLLCGEFAPTASQADYPVFTGSAAGSPGNVTMTPSGTDTNINNVLAVKGTGVVKVSGDMQFGGSAPVVSSCGSGTLTTGSVDHKGSITGITAATACTITFSQALGTGPGCAFNDSAGTAVGISSLTTAAVTTTQTALTGSLYYVCF